MSVRTVFGQVISSQPGPWWGAAARVGLHVAELPYRWAVSLRNRRYDQGRATVYNVGVPVVSVGNITAGGTGKTPMVAWLGRWFCQRGVRVAFVSRGYKSAGSHYNDEARELQQVLPEVPHLQNPDRVTAARQAIADSKAQVIVLDDAFQHRRIHRDLDIVLIDALRPFGYRHVLPRGLLREPLTGLRRADIIALSRADAVEPDVRRLLHDEVMAVAPDSKWIELTHKPSHLINRWGTHVDLRQVTGRRVVAFCGIGNPAGFRATLATLGCHVQQFIVFPDHHDYAGTDLELLAGMITATAPPIDFVLCTHKDLVKLATDTIAAVPLRAVAIDIEVSAGQTQLEQRLEQLVAGA